MLLGFNKGDGIPDGSIQLPGIPGSKVSQVSIFGVSPNLFWRVKLRGIARQPFHVDSAGMLPKVVLKQPCLVHAPFIQDKDDSSAKRAPDRSKEFADIRAGDILCVDREVEVEAPSLGRETKAADNREAVVLLALVVDRRLAFRRPGSAQDRLEHKAALVDKNNGAAFSGGVFLYAASVPCATSGFPLCSVRGHSVGVSDMSSLNHGVSSRHGRDGRRCRNVPLSRGRLGEASRVGWDNCRRLVLGEGVLGARLSVLKTAGRDGEDEVAPLRLLGLLFLLYVSTRLPMKRKI